MRPNGRFFRLCSIYFPMEQQMIMLYRSDVEHMIRMAIRAEGFCRDARPVSYPQSDEDLHAEPTEFYSGASGYARATLRECIQVLESAL